MVDVFHAGDVGWLFGWLGGWRAFARDGKTALMLAADGGHTETVSVLVGAGAALDVVDKMVLVPCLVQYTQGEGGWLGALGGGWGLLKVEWVFVGGAACSVLTYGGG